MRYPPRLAHLATNKIVAARLAPGFGQAHNIDDAEALERLERALPGPLLEDLLAATWAALQADRKRFDPDRMLDESGHAGSGAGGDQSADAVELRFVEGDGHLARRHTDHHTLGACRSAR